MNMKIIGAALVALFIIGGGITIAVNKNNTKNAPSTHKTENTTSKQTDEDKKTTTASSHLKKQVIGEKADCSLYSTDEVSKIWGAPITDTDIDTVISTSDGGKLYACDYNETDSGLGLTFIIEYREFQSEDAAKQDIANVRDGAKFGDTVYFVQDEVENIGDEAFFSIPENKVNDPKNPNVQLYARSKNVVYLISGVNIDGVKSDYKDKILESFKLHLQ